ncbi:hypothetical protein L4P64_004474 [Pseudomonas aeruginosa]|uniref:hypothetical protein n=1 Tax=Pseudomonas aeruginosa TaxID=287 RepID=UPI002A661A54|nr:hypothetical protein [Pseudomonas aeruginosa]EMA3568486.1 hypothetical protein [Pseudomonas aeruginosa]HEP9773996.1 hypothetical protein [Pseudomonas aeruginosa]
MTIIKHPTNPAIFVGTPDEFGLAVEGDFSAAGHWIASVNGVEQDLMCLDSEQAMREGERVFALATGPIARSNAEVTETHPPLMQVATQDLAVLKRQEKLQQLNIALQGLWDGLNVTPRYVERVEPIDPRDDEIHFTFSLEEEDIADQLIRAARRALASFGAEYWLPHYHPRAAQFRQEEHMQFKVRKSLIVSHLYWGVSFILCEPEEGYSLVEDHQP